MKTKGNHGNKNLKSVIEVVQNFFVTCWYVSLLIIAILIQKPWKTKRKRKSKSV
jgi:hypothetical protein